MWSLIDPNEVPELPDLWGDDVRRGLPGGRGRGPVRAAGQGARPLRPDDAHAGADRQRLDDVQGRLQRQVQPDRRARATRCTCPTCAPRSSRCPPTARPPCATSARSTSPRTCAGRRGRLGGLARRPCAPPCRSSTGSSTSTTTRARRRRRPTRAGGRSGSGVMGLQDVFFALRLPFDSAGRARAVHPDRRGDLPDRAGGVGRPGRAARRAPGVRGHPGRAGAAAAGPLGRDGDPDRALGRRCGSGSRRPGCATRCWSRSRPTATIASIAGCYECIEPQVSNLFKRETLSGEFLQVNTALVRELKSRGLWTPQVRDAIKRADGSVQGIVDAAGGGPGSCSAPRGSCRSGR